MIAKLRVGWIVAGCAPGVRTITSRFLFHCTTWFTDCAGDGSGVFRPPSEAPYEWPTWAASTAHRTVSLIHIFVIERSPCWSSAYAAELVVSGIATRTARSC